MKRAIDEKGDGREAKVNTFKEWKRGRIGAGARECGEAEFRE